MDTRTDAAGPAPRTPKGGSTVTQHRVAGLAVEQSDLAPEAEPAPRPALAAGVAAKLAPLDPERHRALQRLGRLDRPDVAEVDVAPGARAILPEPGAVAAGGRLVVGRAGGQKSANRGPRS